MFARGITASHCMDLYSGLLFHCCLLEGGTARPGRLHAMLCNALLVCRSVVIVHEEGTIKVAFISLAIVSICELVRVES